MDARWHGWCNEPTGWIWIYNGRQLHVDHWHFCVCSAMSGFLCQSVTVTRPQVCSEENLYRWRRAISIKSANKKLMSGIAVHFFSEILALTQWRYKTTQMPLLARIVNDGTPIAKTTVAQCRSFTVPPTTSISFLVVEQLYRSIATQI